MTDIDEFGHLPIRARALGVEPLDAERVSLSLRDGRTLSAIRFGQGDPQVTFLHGAGLNAHTWDTTALLLSGPALAIDLAGHGDSSWRDDADYSPHLLADDIIDALPRWSSRQQVLVGQSLGGLTAAVVAAKRPELVEELIIVDIVPGLDTSAGLIALREFFSGPTDFSSRDEMTDRALTFGLGGTREETALGVLLNTRVRPDGRVEWKHHLARLIPNFFGEEGGPDLPRHEAVWDDLIRVKAPTTLVRASAGFIGDDAAVAFASRLPRAKVVSVDATHNVQETAPAALAAVVFDALRT